MSLGGQLKFSSKQVIEALIFLCSILAFLSLVMFGILIGKTDSKSLFFDVKWTDVISSIGSVIAGIAASIAAYAAVIGVNGWLKQLRVGKSLVVVWDAQVALRKVHAAEITWYVYTYKRSEDSNEQREQEQREQEVEKALEVLNSCAHELDAIVVKNQFEWVNKVMDVRSAWKDIKTYLDSHTKPRNKDEILKESVILAPKNKHFLKVYNEYLEQLESLERVLK
ncbi:hypothetical protein [Vibrio cholerae]|uniref:hypothetical protein n=1 Tax=Vibrio cholerae TaxID=666 RepID=UPI00227166E0|nr:hypothetical protein [Vibrio cholerae]MCX9440011.1 hypothetical protein [Vibrio cholerae]